MSQMFPARETLFSQLGKFKKYFKTTVLYKHKQYFKVHAANVSQKMFPSLPTVGNTTKHQQQTMFS